MISTSGHPEIVRVAERGADAHAVTASWNVTYTIFAPTTVTLGKTGVPWNTDGEYRRQTGPECLVFRRSETRYESARLLLKAGVDVNEPAADGTTPLLAALYHRDQPSTVFIPGKGAPAQAGTYTGFARQYLQLPASFLNTARPQAVRWRRLYPAPWGSARRGECRDWPRLEKASPRATLLC